MTYHAIKRARERYGVTLTDQDFRKLERQCIDRTSVLVNAQITPEAELHMVRHNGTIMAAVFKPSANIILTFLEEQCLKAGARERAIARHKQPKKRRKKSRIRSGRRAKSFPKPRTD